MEIRIPEDSDFDKIRTMCDDTKSWKLVFHKRTVRVWTKPTPDCSFHQMKARSEFSDVSCGVVYDVLHDPHYRPLWDKYMVDCKDLGFINPNSDICYYAVSSPSPVKNRDFVLQRSWLDTGSEQIIYNHSVCHDDYIPGKSCVRAISHLTGYLIRGLGTNCCQVTYITHCDPRGKLPSWLVNRLTQIVTPKVMKRLHKACVDYPAWKQSNAPDWKPWRFAHQLPDHRVDLSKCVPKVYDNDLVVDESNVKMDTKALPADFIKRDADDDV